jgi:hypothetical protein
MNHTIAEAEQRVMQATYQQANRYAEKAVSKISLLAVTA